MKLLNYQRKWIEDQELATITLAARHIGMSWAAALLVAEECEAKGTAWTYYTTGERAVLAWVKQLEDVLQKPFRQKRKVFAPDGELIEVVIEFANGSKICAKPYSEGTVRGFSGNVILDNLAFSGMTVGWVGSHFTLTGTDKVRIISAMNEGDPEAAEAFARLWHESVFYHHKITIYDARNDGLPLDPSEIYSGLSETAWRRQFLCEWDPPKPKGLEIKVSMCPEAREALRRAHSHADTFKYWTPIWTGLDPAAPGKDSADALFFALRAADLATKNTKNPKEREPMKNIKVAGILLKDKKLIVAISTVHVDAGHHTQDTYARVLTGTCDYCKARVVLELCEGCDRIAVVLHDNQSSELLNAMKTHGATTAGFSDPGGTASDAAMHYALEACAGRLADLIKEGKKA